MVKKFITVAMGASSEMAARNSLARERFNGDLFSRIHSGVQKRYPKLQLFNGWGIFAQNLEGQILKDVMLEGIKEDIVCLPVHDAVAVQQQHQDWAREVMLETWQEHLGGVGANAVLFLKANLFGVITTILLVGIVFTSLTPLSDQESLRPTKVSVSCSFDRHSAAKPPNGSAADFQKAATYLAFVDGKTSSKTGKLDGAVRATNSNQWYELKSDYGGLSLIGDDGDLLVIWAKPEDGVGIFTASLQWSYMPTYAFTSLGKCSLER